MAGIAENGSLLEFHAAEVLAREQIGANSQRSILVIDHSKFGRLAPAVGDNIADADTVILDRSPNGNYATLLEGLQDNLILTDARNPV